MTEFEAFPTDFARIDEFGVVVMTVPKAAHSAIMLALARTFAPTEDPATAIKRWRSHGSVDVPQDYLSVGFCRDPLDRFRSCWQDKIATVRHVRPGLAMMGCRAGMVLDEFSDIVSNTEDRDLDRHLMPQHYKFFMNGRLRVQRLFHQGAMEIEWETFGWMVLTHCRRRLVDLERVNVSAPASYRWSERSKRSVRERYKIDEEFRA